MVNHDVPTHKIAMKNTTDKKKKPSLSEQLEETKRMLAIANTTVKDQIDALKGKDKEYDDLAKRKNKEFADILATIGRPFGLDPSKQIQSMFGGRETVSKTINELAGELAGMMGQLLEDRRVADARYQEKENEVRWLRGMVEKGMFPENTKKVDSDDECPYKMQHGDHDWVHTVGKEGETCNVCKKTR